MSLSAALSVSRRSHDLGSNYIFFIELANMCFVLKNVLIGIASNRNGRTSAERLCENHDRNTLKSATSRDVQA